MGNVDWDLVRQLVLALDYHLGAELQALGDLRPDAFGVAEFDGPRLTRPGPVQENGIQPGRQAFAGPPVRTAPTASSVTVMAVTYQEVSSVASARVYTASHD